MAYTQGISSKVTITVKTDTNNDGVQEIYTAVSTMPAAMRVDSICVKSESMMGHEW